jgi:L-alanine-DL-glutamate epimerase-like enolase superfamily enzyme
VLPLTALLHDLAARGRLSVASLLAGGIATRAYVRASALVAEVEPAAAALGAWRLSGTGYYTLKLKVGIDVERDLRRIEAVRTAAAMRIRLTRTAFDDREVDARRVLR